MKNVIVFLVVSVLSLSLLQSAYGFSGSGSGTELDPYIITNSAQLEEMRDCLYAWYRLGNNIDASETETWNSGAGFIPVGDGTHPFAGHLQGNGFTISSLYIYRINTDFVGLFGKVSTNATIEDVTLTEPNMVGRNYCGALAGYTDIAPADCQCSNGYIIGNDYVGGLLGQVTVDINNCISSLVKVHSHDRAGGLVGQGRSLIGCSSSGLVQGNSWVGGLVGYADISGPMADCNSTVSIAATGGNIGGLIGERAGNGSINITNCYAAGSVTGGDNVGGLIGCCSDSSPGGLTNCYSTGNVEGSNTIGGLIGYRSSWWSGSLLNCYSTGNVKSQGAGVGGLIGCMGGASSVTDCDAAGTVTASGDYTGGLIGRCEYYGSSISDCYAFGDVYSGGSAVGGLVGYFPSGQIQRCYSAAEVVTGVSQVGGLTGRNESGQISQCFSISDVNGEGDYIGGLVGYNTGPITTSFAEGDVISEEHYDIGGLVGYNGSTIANCYASGGVTGAEFVGGFVGENTSSGDISKCYSTGSVTGAYNSGGFAAWNSGGCSYNYWDTQTSGWAISACGTGKTTEEMMHKSTYEPEWDFEAVWGIDEGRDYPVLVVFFVPTCGDPWHPYPVGDLNHDCRVNFVDFAIFSSHWLECTDPNCG